MYIYIYIYTCAPTCTLNEPLDVTKWMPLTFHLLNILASGMPAVVIFSLKFLEGDFAWSKPGALAQGLDRRKSCVPGKGCICRICCICCIWCCICWSKVMAWMGCCIGCMGCCIGCMGCCIGTCIGFNCMVIPVDFLDRAYFLLLLLKYTLWGMERGRVGRWNWVLISSDPGNIQWRGYLRRLHSSNFLQTLAGATLLLAANDHASLIASKNALVIIGDQSIATPTPRHQHQTNKN